MRLEVSPPSLWGWSSHWWTPIFFKPGWKSGNKPSPGKMMLISQLPWSFLLAKVLALSVQERIEGWIVDFFICCWLVPGARVFPEIIWGYLQWPVVLSVFFLPPNPWGNDPILYLLAPKKIPTGPTYRSLRWFVDRNLARRFVDMDKKSRIFTSYVVVVEGKFVLTKDLLKKNMGVSKVCSTFFWLKQISGFLPPASMLYQKKPPEWPNGVVIPRMTDTRSVFHGEIWWDEMLHTRITRNSTWI